MSGVLGLTLVDFFSCLIHVLASDRSDRSLFMIGVFQGRQTLVCMICVGL